jgi:hypothetical protein
MDNELSDSKSEPSRCLVNAGQIGPFQQKMPCFNLKSWTLVTWIFLLVDGFSIGFTDSSSIMMTFSLMAGLYTALDFNLNLFQGLVLLFLTKIYI